MTDEHTEYVKNVAALAGFAKVVVPHHVFMHEALMHAQEQKLPSLETINRWRRSLGWHELEKLT